MALVISVPYTILADGGVTESAEPMGVGPQAHVTFKCAWRDRYQLVQDLVGTWYGAGVNIVRTPAFYYPPSPNLFCTGITEIRPQVERFVGSSPWSGYENAIVKATFSVPGYTQTGLDPYTRYQFGASGEFLTLPGTVYQFGDGTPTEQDPGFVMPQLEITRTRFKMPFVPLQQMLSALGKINSGSITMQGYSFPAYTLLFVAGNGEPEIDVLGNIAWTIEYKLMYRPVNWNYYMHPNRTTGWAVVTDGNGNSPYSTADFTQLP